MRTEPVIVGYWRRHVDDNTDDLPWPIPNELTIDQATIIFNLILKKEKTAGVKRYRGFSRSRITKECLGSIEYETSKFIWPGDYAKHYVLEHRVKPPKNFLDWIGYKETENAV